VNIVNGQVLDLRNQPITAVDFILERVGVKALTPLPTMPGPPTNLAQILNIARTTQASALQNLQSSANALFAVLQSATANKAWSGMALLSLDKAVTALDRSLAETLAGLGRVVLDSGRLSSIDRSLLLLAAESDVPDSLRALGSSLGALRKELPSQVSPGYRS